MQLYSRDLVHRAREKTGAGVLHHPSHESRISNPICGDKVRWTLQVSANRVVEAKHETRGCVLCQASASLLFDRVQGKDILAVFQDISQFQAEIEDILQAEEAVTESLFSGLQHAPSRVSCVLLPWEGLEKALRGA